MELHIKKWTIHNRRKTRWWYSSAGISFAKARRPNIKHEFYVPFYHQGCRTNHVTKTLCII